MNIVFDFGQVVFSWKPQNFVKKFFYDPAVCLAVTQAIFEHPDWQEIDRGTLTLDELTKSASQRTGIAIEQLAVMVAQIPTSLEPIPETVEIIRQLNQNGHKLYALSNMGLVAMDYLEKNYPFLDLFEGKVISSRLKLIKPDPEIFKYLLNKFNLDPQQTVYIDDYAPNIKAAAGLGFLTIQFTTPDLCKEELVALGCFK